MINSREQKRKAVKEMIKLKITNPKKAEYQAIADAYGLKIYQVQAAYQNFITYGYIDGAIKSNKKVAKHTGVYTKNKERIENYRKEKGWNELYTNSKKVTQKDIDSAVAMYFAGAKLRNIYHATGVGINTLYRTIRKIEAEQTPGVSLILGRAKANREKLSPNLRSVQRYVGKAYITRSELAYISVAKSYIGKARFNICIKKSLVKLLSNSKCFNEKDVKAYFSTLK